MKLKGIATNACVIYSLSFLSSINFGHMVRLRVALTVVSRFYAALNANLCCMMDVRLNSYVCHPKVDLDANSFIGINGLKSYLAPKKTSPYALLWAASLYKLSRRSKSPAHPTYQMYRKYYPSTQKRHSDN